MSTDGNPRAAGLARKAAARIVLDVDITVVSKDRLVMYVLKWEWGHDGNAVSPTHLSYRSYRAPFACGHGCRGNHRPRESLGSCINEHSGGLAVTNKHGATPN